MHGVKRRASSFNTGRVDHLYVDPHEADGRFHLHYGDLTDATNLIRIPASKIEPERGRPEMKCSLGIVSASAFFIVNHIDDCTDDEPTSPRSLRSRVRRCSSKGCASTEDPRPLDK